MEHIAHSTTQMMRDILRASTVFFLGFTVVACGIHDEPNWASPGSTSAIHGFLLDGEPGQEPMAKLTNGSQADIIMFLDEDCSICSSAIQQAQALSVHRRIMVAPIALGDSKQIVSAADYERAVWQSNGTAFKAAGSHGLPSWMGVDACGKHFHIQGILLPSDLRRMTECQTAL